VTKTRKASIAVGALLVTVAVGLAQGPFPFGGFGGGGGPSQLIRIQQIQKELKITPEQMKKIDAGFLKVIADTLEGDQNKRLKQISLQVRGFAVFADPAVQSELKFTDKQKDSVKKIIKENAEKMKELFAEGFGGFAKIQELQKETGEKVTGVLTDAQKDQWKEMIGAEFKFQFKGFKKKDK
jgi:Spy/CpxP family protein refolding chaperone